MKKSLLITLIFLGLTHSAKAQSFDPNLAANLQKTVDSLQSANNIKGISACVIYPGQGTWKGVAGVSHTGFPITPDMEFGIASNTKTFTGVLILKLVENNIVNLDDSLYEWLPNFANIDSNITVRQLLNHTSGLADINSVIGYSDSILANPYRVYAPFEVMTWVGPPLFAAGTSWSYSNTNYLLAGMIAESATSQNYGQLLHDSILSPLQLDSTFLDVYDSVLFTVAHPWQGGVDRNSIPRKALNSTAWSAGAMYSTAGEMAQWYQSLMGGQVLNANSFNEMTTFVGAGDYGVGLNQIEILGRTVWRHGGAIWGGYNSTMLYDTAAGIVICLLINQNPAQSFNIAKELLSVIINSPVSISENTLREEPFTIYPNPTNGNINVDIHNQKIQHVKIFNTTGGLLKEFHSNTFSMTCLPAGLYFITVQTDKATLVSKLIKH